MASVNVRSGRLASLALALLAVLCGVRNTNAQDDYCLPIRFCLYDENIEHPCPDIVCDQEPNRCDYLAELGILDKDLSDPVYLFNGEFIHKQVDMEVSGVGLDFKFERTYRSRTGAYDQRGIVGPMGRNWDHSYNIRVTPHPDIDEESNAYKRLLVLWSGNGREDLFAGNGDWDIADSKFTRQEFFTEIVVESTGALVMPQGNGVLWRFFAMESTASTAPGGYIKEIVDRNGNKIEFVYASGRLSQIVDTVGRTFTLTYDGSGRIQSLSDWLSSPDTRTVTFEYYGSNDDDGNVSDLKAVNLPPITQFGGGTTSRRWEYTYEVSSTDYQGLTNLLTIRDPNGQVILENVYPCPLSNINRPDRVVRQFYGGERYDYYYESGDYEAQIGIPTSQRTVVVNRAGQVKELYFNGNGFIVHRRDKTDAESRMPPCAVALPNLLPPRRPSDRVELYQTWVIDDEGRRTASSHSESPLAIDTQYDTTNPNRHKQRNILSQTTSGTANGQAISVTESWSYGFDLPTGTGCSCGSGGFPTSHTDANQNITRMSYDAQGNLVRRFVDLGSPSTTDTDATSGVLYQTDLNDLAIDDWAYSGLATATVAGGQLTQHVHPVNGPSQRQSDSFTYYTKTAAAGKRGRLQSMTTQLSGGNLVTTYDYDIYGNASIITDPKSNVTYREYNEANLLKLEERRTSSSDVLARKAWYYDANLNVVRTDEWNLDQGGDAIGSGLLTTVTRYDILGKPTWIREQLDVNRSVSATVRDPAEWPSDPEEAAEYVSYVDTKYEYDANENLTKIIKGEAVNGSQEYNVVERTYDEWNRLLTETSGAGSANPSTTFFRYSARGLLEERIDGYAGFGGSTTTYEYDGIERLAIITDPLGNTTAYDYDDNGNMLAVIRRDALGTRLTESEYVYDALNRPYLYIQKIFGPGVSSEYDAVTEVHYYDDSSVAWTRDARNNTTSFLYDAAGRMVQRTDAASNTITYSYDSNSNVTKTVRVDLSDVQGEASQQFNSTWAYDALDRVILQTEEFTTSDGGADNRSTWEYDSRGHVVRYVDPRNNATLVTWDGLGRELATTRVMSGGGAANIVTSKQWDSSSRLTAQIDDNGNAVRYAYDEADRPIAVRYADGTMTQIGSGIVWPVGQSNPTLTGFISGYDPRSNPLTVTDALGTVTTTAYDANDRPTARTVSRYAGTSGILDSAVLGTTHERYAYDGLGRVIAAQDDDTLVVRSYESRSLVASETTYVASEFDEPYASIPAAGSNPDWLTTSLAAVTSAMGRTVQFSYDAVGNISTTVYPSGRDVRAIYDGLNRTSFLLDYANGQQVGSAIAGFSYIGPDRLSRRSHRNGTQVRMTWDGWVGSVGYTNGDYGIGRISRIDHLQVDSGGTPTATILARQTTWDEAQNKTMRRNLTSAVTGANLLAPLTHSGLPIARHDYGYDAADRLINTQEPTGADLGGLPLLRDETYTLDGVHNRTSVTGTSASSGGTYGMVAGVANDAVMNQYTLRQYTSSGSHRDNFTYDDESNLKTLATDVAGDVNGDLKTNNSDLSIVFAQFNQSVAPWTSGDVNGDGVVNGADLSIVLTNFGILWGHKQLAYDYRNQMVRYRAVDTMHSASETHLYAYDCFGRRVRKVTDLGDISKERVHRFTWGGASGWQLAQLETFAVGGDPDVRTFVYSGGESGYIDDVVSMRRDADGPAYPSGPGSSGTAVDYFYHQDDLFSIVALTDESGDVVERYEYGDYGQVYIYQADGTTLVADDFVTGRKQSPVGNPHTFTGREYDAETGLLQYRTRYLHTGLGRFTTRDTIGVWGDPWNSGNGFGYVGTCPTSAWDPQGTFLRELWENTREGLEGVGDWIDEWMPKPVQRIIKDYVLPNTPIIGTILDVRDWAQAYCYGDDTDLALATMGIVPFGDFFKPLSKVLKKLNIPKIRVPGGGVPHAPAIVPSHVPKAKTPGTPGKPASPTVVPAKSKESPGRTMNDPLPRGPGGEPIPDPDARGPHSQLGTQPGRNGPYRQAREFDAGGNPVRDIDFTDHGRPSVPGHTNPHQHPYIPNPTGGTPQRGGPQPME